MIQNWIKVAFRNFAKNKLATFINTFGLTIGLVGLILTILYQYDQFSYDRWIPEKDRIFAVGHVFDNDKDVWGVSNPQMEKAKANVSEIEEILLVSAMGYADAMVKVEDRNVQSVKTINATKNFFEFYPFDFIEGNTENALNADNYIAVSEQFAQKLFGKENAMGKTVQIGDNAYVIHGVYRLDKKASIMPEIVIPFKKLDDYWGNYTYNGYIKTKQPMTASAIKQKFDDAVWKEELNKEAKEEGLTPEEYLKIYPFESVFVPIENSRFDLINSVTHFEPYGNRSIMKIMLGISILILMISVVNFINLSLAGAIRRAKEVGVRKSVGAEQKDIVFQSLFETFILTVFSCFLALVLIELILPYFNQFMKTEITINYALFLVQVLLIVIGTTLLTGIIPAFYIAKFKTIEVLKGSFSRSSRGIYLRNAMLGLQFMIASFFFIGSLIVYFQISYLNKLDLGFDKQQILVLNFNRGTDKPFQDYSAVKTYLQNLKGVTAVNSVRPLVGTETGYSTTEIKYQDKKVVNILYNSIDFGYPEMMGMKLLKGRFLSEKYASDTINNIVINETMAKELGIYDDPIHKKLNNDITVVGMVKDYHIFDAYSPVQPAFMQHWKSFESNMIYNMGNVVIKFQPEHLDEILQNLEKYWPENVVKNQPFSYSFLDKNFEKTYEQYVRQQHIFGIMTGIVILIALLGLYALSSFIIEQRLKEIAIRKTLGAKSQDIIGRFAKPYLLIGATSILLSFPLVAYFGNEWLQDFAFRVSMPWLAFVICFFVLLMLSFLVVSIKAWAATRIDLVKYLKYE